MRNWGWIKASLVFSIALLKEPSFAVCIGVKFTYPVYNHCGFQKILLYTRQIPLKFQCIFGTFFAVLEIWQFPVIHPPNLRPEKSRSGPAGIVIDSPSAHHNSLSLWPTSRIARANNTNANFFSVTFMFFTWKHFFIFYVIVFSPCVLAAAIGTIFL